jgi:hypothetical protein
MVVIAHIIAYHPIRVQPFTDDILATIPVWQCQWCNGLASIQPVESHHYAVWKDVGLA